jgi:ferritin-like metal-binding protein YciE
MATTNSKASGNGQATKGKTKPKSQAAEDLRELLEDELKDIYWAEKALTKALPKMAKNASDPGLIKALNNHLAETLIHVQRLEQAFELLGKPVKAKKCEAMDGLLKEGEGIIEETQIGPVRDAGIILACQKVEHYEIATYGTIKVFASLLGEQKLAALFDKTLSQEKNADATLTQLAESNINLEARDEETEGNEKAKKPTRKIPASAMS